MTGRTSRCQNARATSQPEAPPPKSMSVTNASTCVSEWQSSSADSPDAASSTAQPDASNAPAISMRVSTSSSTTSTTKACDLMANASSGKRAAIWQIRQRVSVSGGPLLIPLSVQRTSVSTVPYEIAFDSVQNRYGPPPDGCRVGLPLATIPGASDWATGCS